MRTQAEAIHNEILQQQAVYADETSWRVANKRAWLWGLFSKDKAYYEIAQSRGGKVAKSLIPGTYQGIVHTDCYSGYSYLHSSQRQLCFAHLKRHFLSHAERAGPAKTFGERGLALCRRAFLLSGQSTALQRKRLIKDMDKLILLGLEDESTKTMALTLNKHRGSLWHCLSNPQVEATNNHAERMIRPAVIKRKLSFGSGSTQGAKALSALFSVVTTSRLQGKSPYHFIEQTIRSAMLGQSLPQLA